MQVVLFTDVNEAGIGRYAGTYRIATALREAGYTVQVIDFFTSLGKRRIKKLIDKFITKKTLWCGFSTTFLRNREFGVNGFGNNRFYYEDIEDIFSWIKEANNNCKIVIGGHEGYSFLADIYDQIDYIIQGPADTSVVEFTNNINTTMDKIIISKNYPEFDFSKSRIIYEDNDCIFDGEHLPVEIARGCIFKCSFCCHNLNNKKLWEFNRDPAIVASDLQEYHDRFGSEGFMFCDDTYNDSVEKITKLHTEFKKLPFEFEFSAYARHDLIFSNWDTAKILYESGLRSTFFGIESFNHKAAKSIGKGMDPEKIKDGLYRLKDEYPDLILSAGFIIGLPFDTEETIQKQMEWLVSSDCPLDEVSTTALYIGKTDSGFSHNPQAYGYEVDENNENWISEYMTETRARELRTYWLNEFRKNNRNKSVWTFYNRYKNLGFNPDEIKDENYPSIELQKRKKIFEYYQKLLAI